MRAMRTWTNDCYRLVLLLMGSRPMGPEGADRLPPDMADAYEDVVRHGKDAPADLDDAMEAVLASAGIELPADGRAGHRVSTLDSEQRQEMVTQLMMQRNKVTHIYELVKAYGSTMQIRFNRQDKGSRRAARKTSAWNEAGRHRFRHVCGTVNCSWWR